MYVTPDDTDPAIVGFVVFLPDDSFLIAAFAGAMLTLTSARNWQEVGTMTPEQAALIFLECYGETFPLEPTE